MQHHTILRAKEAAAMLGVSKSTLWAWCSPKSEHYRPDAPRPVKLSPRITGWLEREISDYIVKLAEQRAKPQHDTSQQAT